MGPAGQEVADALLENQSLIQQMNATQRTIADVTQTTAAKLTDARFGDKIDALGKDVTDLIHGLERLLENLNLPALNDKTREFINAVDKLANAMNRVIGGGDNRNAPGLDHGGVVSRTGLAVVHKGESVSPNGGGVNVTVNGWVGNDQALARKIRDELVNLKGSRVSLGLG